MANGRAPLSIGLHASSEETANGSGASVDLHASSIPRSAVSVALTVSAASGTFTAGQGLTVILEHSADEETWTTLSSFATVASTTYSIKVSGGSRRYLRARWTITGTASPAFTFKLDGTASVSYADPADFDIHGLPSKATDGVSDEIKVRTLLACSDMIDGRMFTATDSLPLKSWGEDVRALCVDLASWRMMARKGFNPELPGDLVVRQRYDDAVSWLAMVSAGKGSTATTDQTPDVSELGATVYTPRRARWS